MHCSYRPFFVLVPISVTLATSCMAKGNSISDAACGVATNDSSGLRDANTRDAALHPDGRPTGADAAIPPDAAVTPDAAIMPDAAVTPDAPMPTNDPFEATSCPGPVLSQAAAVAKFAAGATSATLAKGALVTRSRRCNVVTGCTAWSATTYVRFRESAVLSVANGTLTAALQDLDSELTETDIRYYTQERAWLIMNQSPAVSLYRYATGLGVEEIAHDGRLSVNANCLQFTASVQRNNGNGYNETQWGYLVRY